MPSGGKGLGGSNPGGDEDGGGAAAARPGRSLLRSCSLLFPWAERGPAEPRGTAGPGRAGGVSAHRARRGGAGRPQAQQGPAVRPGRAAPGAVVMCMCVYVCIYACVCARSAIRKGRLATCL